MTTTREELTVTQAAERLGHSEQRVRDMCGRGELRARKVPMDSAPYERWAVDAAAVDRYTSQSAVDVDALTGKRALVATDAEQVPVQVLGWMRQERNTVRVARLDSDGRTVVDASEIVDVHDLRQHPDGPEPEGGEFWYVCSKCGQAKPEHDYYTVRADRYAGGTKRVPECKACHLEGKREHDRAYYAANREDIAARQHAAWKASQEREQAALCEAGYIPTDEAQERLGVSRQFVGSLAKRGKIERHPSRRGWYAAASVDRYLEEKASM
jgi:hypothetical protein